MKNALKLISMYVKDNMQSQAISELYTDDKKSKCSSNPNDILNQIICEKLYSTGFSPKLPLLTF